MANNLSPSFSFREINLGLVVPRVAANVAAYAGEFTQGPAMQPTLITSDLELEQIFGRPTNSNYKHWYTVWNYLQYSSPIYVVRAISSTAKNAGIAVDALVDYGGVTITPSPVFVTDVTVFTPTFSAGQKLLFLAQNPGEYGNSIKVAFTTHDNFNTTTPVYPNGPTFASLFDRKTSNSNEIALVVLDGDNNILEKFIVNVNDPSAKSSTGESVYAETYVNKYSNYIYLFVDESADDLDSMTVQATALSGGTDGAALTDGDITAAYDLLVNKNDYDITLLIGGANTSQVVRDHIIQNVAEVRRDCVAFVDCQEADVVGAMTDSERTDNVINYFSSVNSLYAACYANWKWQYDKYADKHRWMPISGDMAGLWSLSALENDPWVAAAGTSRGIVKNVTKLAWNPDLDYRDRLYVEGINSIITEKGIGTYVIGQKINTAESSARDRINVRMLLIYIEKSLAQVLPSFLFEFNDEFTRSQVRSVVEGFMKDIEGRRGVYDPLGGDAFYVKCDTQNNTPEKIDRHELVVDLFLKPNQTIEFITLNVIIARSGVKFEELVSQ